MSIKVLISDKMDPRAAEIFRERGIEVDERPGLSPDELKAIIEYWKRTPEELRAYFQQRDTTAKE